MAIDRRSFVRQAFTGIAGSAVLSHAARESLLARGESLADELADAGDTENYWEIVKNHFTLDSGLQYFT